jgi:L,D-transpeptidase catalytic domain
MRRLRLLGLGVLLALLPACGSTGRAHEPFPTSSPTFAVAGPDPQDSSSVEPAVGGDTVVASKTGPFRVFEMPGSTDGVRRYRAVNDWGQQLWLPAIGERVVALRGWLHVRLPDRPNGSTGWVRARDVDTGTVRDRIVVRLRRHTLVRYENGESVERVRVAIGKPSTPTTAGRFFVWARVGYEETDGPYGNFALGLSAFSNVITNWPGGGRMAIHGTSDPSLAGKDVSNGCIRVFNPFMASLIDVPMGATVIIRR